MKETTTKETAKENPLASHKCGRGRYAREVWGNKKDCKRCQSEEAYFEKLRKATRI